MYNNPAGPVAASAGLGGGGLALMSGSWTLLFVFIGAFALIGAIWAAMRFLPAGVTERPRALVERVFAPRNAVAGRRTVKRYDFSAKQR